MNELLGWYGYEKVDSRDTQGLNLHHFAGPSSPTTPPTTHHSDSSSDVTSPTASPPPGTVEIPTARESREETKKTKIMDQKESTKFRCLITKPDVCRKSIS